MTLARISATGRGKISARLVVEGLGAEFVSASRMEKTTADGRVRVRGLQLDDIVIGASADLMRATLEATGFEAKIANLDRIAGSRHGRPTQYLTRTPQTKLFLAADITPTDTTVTLRSVVGLASSGVVHIATEAIKYTSISGNDLQSCTRGYWQTLAQAHFARDGEGLGDALVTEIPRSLEGRRCYLYLYGDGDDPQGDGTLRWKGIVSTEAAWSGGVVSFHVDPMTRLLAQPIGGDLSGAIGARGIKYTNTAPFVITVIEYPSGAEEKRGTQKIDGFYETQEEFAAAVSTMLTQALSAGSISLGSGARLQAQARQDAIEIVYVTASSSPVNIGVYISDGYQSVIERAISFGGTTSPGHWSVGGTEIDTMMGDRSWSPPVTTRFSFTIPSPVPRGTLGKYAFWMPYHTPPDTGLESLEYLLPMAGLVAPTEASVLIPHGDEWGEDPRPISVYSVSGRNAYLRCDRNLVPYNIRTSFEMGRFIASGSVVDLLTQLILDSPDTCNAGAMPLIDGADILPSTDVDAAVVAEPLAHNRGFFAFEGDGTLGDFVVPELLVIGAYQRLGLTGSIEWDRLRPPLSTDAATWTIDDSAIISPALERAPHGTLAQVSYSMGYDPRTGEWDKRTITYRDVQTTSATRAPITLKIAQLSTSSGYYTGGDDWNTIDRESIKRLAMSAFGFFGSPVVVLLLTTDARYMDARIGDSIAVSTSLLPDPDDGYSSISSRVGMIVSHALELASGRVTLGIVMHTEAFAGYNLGILVASQTNTSGNTWTIDLTLSGYLYAPDGGADIASHLSVGDVVRVAQADTTSTVEVEGVVDSISDADTVVVTFSSTWTPGTDEWFLVAGDADAYSRGESLARYAHVADVSHLVDYIDVQDVTGWVFA